MRTETIEIFTYDELSDKAKENARDRWRDSDLHNDWYGFIYDDADTIGGLMGIEIDSKSYKTYGGGQATEPKIWFSGFWSQGDGACFEGSYSYQKNAVKAIKEYAPQDETLHEIAKELQEIQRRNFYQLTATCKHSGHYYHSGCMSVEVMRGDDWSNIEDEQALTEILRRFADWIYRQLQSEYEYQTSDEAIEETIHANEYEFYADGKMA